MKWLKRWQQRQNEIAQGADEDLFRDNRRWYQCGIVLFALGILLGWTASKLQPGHTFHTIVIITAALLVVGGLLLFRWAWRVDMFLRSSEKEGPPSIFRR